MIQYDEHIFQRGWFNHQPVTHLPTIDPNFQRNIQAPLKHACLEKQQEIQGFMKGSYLQVDCCLIRPIISWGVNPYFVKPFVGPDDETPSSWGAKKTSIELPSWRIYVTRHPGGRRSDKNKTQRMLHSGNLT